MSSIAAYDYALRNAVKNLDDNFEHVTTINRYLREELMKSGDDYKIISKGECSPYIVNFALKYVRGEVMLHSLEKYEIFVGTGSACSSKKTEKSLPNIAKLSEEYEKGVLRVSFDEKTTKEDIDHFIKYLNLEYSKLVKYMRG